MDQQRNNKSKYNFVFLEWNTTTETQIQTENNLDKLRQQVIALQMDIKNCQSDLDKIKELLE